MRSTIAVLLRVRDLHTLHRFFGSALKLTRARAVGGAGVQILYNELGYDHRPEYGFAPGIRPGAICGVAGHLHS